VNAVRASNWQGKSSFLTAIEAAFGTETRLTEGQDYGQVKLSTDATTYTVHLERSNGSISQSGTPYPTDDVDRVCADLFAFLDETNEVRQAVRMGENLETVLTRPLDFENIDQQIADLKAEQKQVESELDRAQDAANRLPHLQKKVTKLESELEDLEKEWSELDHESSTDSSARDELSNLRAKLEKTETNINRYESTAERVEERLEAKKEELEELDVPKYTDLEEGLEGLQTELHEIERDKELLQSIYEVNQRVLGENRLSLLTDVSHDIISDQVACWICGNETSREEIDAQLDSISDRLDSLREEEATLRDKVDDLQEKRQTVRDAERKERDFRDRIGELESQLDDALANLEAAEERKASLEAQIDELEERVNETEGKATDLQSEIKYTEAELEDARGELKTVKSEASQREVLEDELESLRSEIEDLRTRKERVKRNTREAFDSALSDILPKFNVGFETARLTDNFDLIVARGGQEASLDALSEGERELLRIIATLAGHEAFDVGTRLPVTLLDGHTGLDDTNIHHLVDYLSERVEVLVLSAFPEYDEFGGHEVTPRNSVDHIESPQTLPVEVESVSTVPGQFSK
jgi:DNA repair exonuclease SbcCD ATPase subunit